MERVVAVVVVDVSPRLFFSFLFFFFFSLAASVIDSLIGIVHALDPLIVLARPAQQWILAGVGNKKVKRL